MEHQGSHHYSAVRGHLHGLVSKDHVGSQNIRSCPVMTRINLLLGCQWRPSEEPGLLPPLNSNKLLFSFAGAVSLKKQTVKTEGLNKIQSLITCKISKFQFKKLFILREKKSLILLSKNQ